MEYATVVAIVDHAFPENGALFVFEGVTSTETTAAAILNDLAGDGWAPILQSSFTMTTPLATASFTAVTLARAT